MQIQIRGRSFRKVVERRDGRVAGGFFSSFFRDSCSGAIYNLLGELSDIVL